MATFFENNTQTEGGTGGIVYDLTTTQGTGATLGSGNMSAGGAFAEVLRFQRTVGTAGRSGSYTVAVDINALTSGVEVRFRLQRLNSSNVVQQSSSYSSTYTTTGVKSTTISFSPTWATGDRLAISVEGRYVSAHGNGTFDLNVNDADATVAEPLVFTGTIASSIQPLTAAASGEQPYSGAIASTLQPLTSAASGVTFIPATGTVASSIRPLTSSLAGRAGDNANVDATAATAVPTSGLFGPYWYGPDTAVVISPTGNSPSVMAAHYTTDGGATWADVTVGASTFYLFSTWFDAETVGFTGAPLVHAMWFESPDGATGDFVHAAFDIRDTSWSTPVALASSVALEEVSRTVITRTRSGNLVAAYNGGTPQGAFKSTNGGTSWSSIAVPYESVGGDYTLGAYCNTGDDNDAAILYWDGSANAISIKVYDDSANTWTETAVASGMSESSSVSNWDASVRQSDGAVLLSAASGLTGSTFDINTYQLAINSVASPTVTTKTAVFTNTAGYRLTAIFIDQATDDVYVSFSAGSGVSWAVQYKKSTDDMGTWGAVTAYSAGTAHLTAVNGGAMAPTRGGRFLPVWFDATSTITAVFPINIVVAATTFTGTVASSVQALTAAAEGTHGAASATGTIASSIRPLTSALTGVMQPSGTVASTLQPLTSAASGAQTQSGAIASTLAPATAAASGTHEQTGTVASSIQPLTASATGAQSYTGTVASTLAPLTASASGTHSQTGTVASSVQPLTAAATGAMQPSGTVSSTLAPLTSAASGAVAQFVGSITATLQPLTSAATGVMHPSGEVASSIQALTSALTGTQTQTGTVASTLAPLTAAATGVMQPSGAVASSLQPLTSAAEGTTTAASATGTVATSLQRLVSAATGAQTQSGAIASSLAPATSALSGTHAQAGTIASALQPLTSASAGTQSYTGTVGSTLAPLTATATGSQPFTGAVAASLQPLTSAAAGGVTSGVTGTVGAVLQPLTSTSSGARLDVIYVVGQAVHAPVASGEARHAAVASGRAQHAATAGVEARHGAIARGKAVHAPTAAEEAVHG